MLRRFEKRAGFFTEDKARPLETRRALRRTVVR